ncbi:helix-turn-helix domain-containing protein [Maridesulfovibrio frigidus]|uniref:helix-turn-helix domain-containing protein n=1 Tax=Maridesulfovibrio frigidus TaxID=340956 RepID=UPI0004E0D258|nr:helix-turn-helix domain-containing protein [Maridesulfovibrio frigidus]
MGKEEFEAELSKLCEKHLAPVSSGFPQEMQSVLREVVGENMKPVFEMEFLKRKENLNTNEVALLYGESAASLRKLRGEGRGPMYTRRGSKILYRKSDLEKFYTSGLVRTIDQPS